MERFVAEGEKDVAQPACSVSARGQLSNELDWFALHGKFSEKKCHFTDDVVAGESVVVEHLGKNNLFV